MSARSSSNRYTAASSAGASPTSRFSASTGTKPASSCSSLAAEYLAAQPPQEARSVSLTLPVSRSTGALPEVSVRGTVGVSSSFVHRRVGAAIYSLRYATTAGAVAAFRGEEELYLCPRRFVSNLRIPFESLVILQAGGSGPPRRARRWRRNPRTRP